MLIWACSKSILTVKEPQFEITINILYIYFGEKRVPLCWIPYSFFFFSQTSREFTCVRLENVVSVHLFSFAGSAFVTSFPSPPWIVLVTISRRKTINAMQHFMRMFPDILNFIAVWPQCSSFPWQTQDISQVHRLYDLSSNRCVD